MRLNNLAFKVLDYDGRTPYQRKRWPMPDTEHNKPGRWTRELPLKRRPLMLCARGYHMCRWQDLFRYANHDGYRVFLAEYRGEVLEYKGDNKFCAQSARLVCELFEYPIFSNDYSPYDYYGTTAEIIARQRVATVKWLRMQGIFTVNRDAKGRFAK